MQSQGIAGFLTGQLELEDEMKEKAGSRRTVEGDNVWVSTLSPLRTSLIFLPSAKMFNSVAIKLVGKYTTREFISPQTQAPANATDYIYAQQLQYRPSVNTHTHAWPSRATMSRTEDRELDYVSLPRVGLRVTLRFSSTGQQSLTSREGLRISWKMRVE